jgi:hypothetical protein
MNMSKTEEKIRDIVKRAHSGLTAQAVDRLSRKQPDGTTRKVEVEMTAFVPASEIIQGEPAGTFWDFFSSGAPFTWGDNNRSMVTASDFLRHLDACDIENDVPKGWLLEVRSILEELGEIYVDLEN